MTQTAYPPSKYGDCLHKQHLARMIAHLELADLILSSYFGPSTDHRMHVLNFLKEKKDELHRLNIQTM